MTDLMTAPTVSTQGVELLGVRKTFGTTVALEHLDLTVQPGELVCLLGPSGCGKTTALRLLAGFERADAGSIRVGGTDITTVPPRRRGFGMVFQDYSLFPHLTARANIGYGLHVRRTPAAQITRTVDELLAVTRLAEHADKFPHQLSGGQKQRVALARAIATRPGLLLLDEPLSALDAQVREHLRDEIRRIQRELGVTTVLVTHDQGEAMAVADRVAVMNAGRLEQIATPRELYRRPATAFVAGFIGTVNRLRARRGPDGAWWVLGAPVDVVGDLAGATADSERLAIVRPEQVEVTAAPAGARVVALSFLGAVTRLTLDHPEEGPVLADVLSESTDALRVGEHVAVAVRTGAGAVVLA
jgi:putative spermidine/putrescine transport system ATP-binding protein